MNWFDFINKETEKVYYKKLVSFVNDENKKYKIHPPGKDCFKAFKRCPLDKLKLIILSQDPYINEGEANGLAFSVSKGIKIPPSLKNIYKELKEDLNIDPPNHGCLDSWAMQGCLLLNTVMTVRAGQSGSHRNQGWETFTDNIIRFINKLDRPIVFMLWGNYAKNKKHLLTNNKFLILESAHPSPFSCSGFFGCKHFSKANKFLIVNNISPIDWKII